MKHAAIRTQLSEDMMLLDEPKIQIKNYDSRIFIKPPHMNGIRSY